MKGLLWMLVGHHVIHPLSTVAGEGEGVFRKCYHVVHPISIAVRGRSIKAGTFGVQDCGRGGFGYSIKACQVVLLVGDGEEGHY